uniref:RHEB like 1 n=1 Tax=Rattus norvegicus TaxID=10116 RepID=A0ABK0M612_RAT
VCVCHSWGPESIGTHVTGTTNHLTVKKLFFFLLLLFDFPAYSKTVTLGKDEFHLHLVDTAGQDKYSILPYSFIIGVHGYVLVYNVTSLRSFQIVKNLYQKLQEGHGKTRLPVLLVGNKADLSADREVQAVEGKKLAESWGATFMESSARDNQLIQDIFIRVIQEIARVENSYGQDRRCCLM